MTRWIEADEIAGFLEPGMTIFVAGGTAEPRDSLDVLERYPERCAGIRFVSVSIPGINRFDFSALHRDTRSTAFFATPENRASIQSGHTEFIPLQYSAIFDYLNNELNIDAVLAQFPPAAGGRISLGLCADFLPAVLDKSPLVIAEINARQPVPADSPTCSPDKIDLAIRCDRPVPEFPSQNADDASVAIARRVSELINDGDCLQIGIGAIPAAVLDELTNKNDLGVHSGMISDGVMALTKAGNITGRNKNLDPNKTVTGTTLGSQSLIEWAGGAADLAIRPVGYTHDVGVIRQIDNFVSINSAVEIDLFGQVNADVLNGRQWTGTGGAVDMMRGAAMSRGGRSIIALKSTTGTSKRSRIVAALEKGTAVTALRTDVDYVVTEFGARRIRHLSIAARAAALIEIAAPEFRDGLRDEWRTLMTRDQ